MSAFNIYNFLPSHFKTPEGTLLAAILTAINESQNKLGDMVESAIDQQFLTTATGKYLLYLGEQSGFVLPPNSGLDIRALRALVPIAVANPKQVIDTLKKLVESFYGSDKVRTTVISTVAEPYSFVDGDDLVVETESGTVSVGFTSASFSDIGNISASELATLLNTMQSVFVADAYLDRKDNKKYLRIASKTASVGSSIRVAGGTAQNVLQIPNVVKTTNVTGTGWTVQKVATYSDLTKISWDNTGTNPQLYQVKAGDVVTIRGLLGAVSGLNGSYVVQDSGYDYFTILNVPYQSLSDSFTQPEDNSIVFTSQYRLGIYDLTEYAISTETLEDTVSFTVPAVPPIARRFLAGSAHLQGSELPVLGFTRSSVTVDNALADTTPADKNSIVLVNDNLRHDFDVKNTYRLAGSDKNTPRVYICDTSDESYATFPFTTATPLDANPIYAEPGSYDYFVKFPFPHGLKFRWGFNLVASSGSSNLTTGDLTKEHVVAEVMDDHTVRFKILDSNGDPVPYHGVDVGPFDVYRWSTPQANGSDFYLEFASSAAVVASGLKVGQTVRLDPNTGTNINAFYGTTLRNQPFEVIAVSDNLVSIRTGYGPGSQGQVIDNVTATRTGSFGGTVSYYFDQTSDWNVEWVMTNLRALFLEYTPSVNPLYVGSFLYDPTGSEYQNTVSSAIVENADEILKGSNPVAIFVTSVEGFPKNGSFIIDYGTDRAEGPINYLSTISNESGNSQILIDPSYKFKFSHDVGALCWFVTQRAPFSPGIDGTDYPVYLTGTSQARNTLLEILKLLVASGIFIDFNVLYPDLKYADPSIEPFA